MTDGPWLRRADTLDGPSMRSSLAACTVVVWKPASSDAVTDRCPRSGPLPRPVEAGCVPSPSPS